jgi:Rps23 Pro-64 3,4-dihydroxylase Tpa1-like proline 4-hydroxylase
MSSEEEYNLILEKIENLANRKEKYFSYRNQVSDATHLSHKVKIQDIEERKKLITKNNFEVFQQWYEVFYEDEYVLDIKYHFRNKLNKILFDLYPELNNSNIEHTDTITLYENEDFILPHKDGQNKGRLCVVLVYLSDPKTYNDGGGRLKLSNENSGQITKEVLPLRPNYAILDFTKHNVWHSVEKVKNNFRRFCYIDFICNRELMIKGPT